MAFFLLLVDWLVGSSLQSTKSAENIFIDPIIHYQPVEISCSIHDEFNGCSLTQQNLIQLFMSQQLENEEEPGCLSFCAREETTFSLLFVPFSVRHSQSLVDLDLLKTNRSNHRLLVLPTIHPYSAALELLIQLLMICTIVIVS